MITYTPFRAAHLQYLLPQPMQARDYSSLLAAGGAEVLENYVALTAWNAKGHCLGMAGCIPIRPHRAVGWMLLSRDAGPAMLSIARKVRRVFQTTPFKRIEISVSAKFPDGQRFARLIGAVIETPEPMRYYGAYEDDEYMYAMIKD